jgi:hypothetical protein
MRIRRASRQLAARAVGVALLICAGAGCTSSGATSSPLPTPSIVIHTPASSTAPGKENGGGVAKTSERCKITSVRAVRAAFGARGLQETVATSPIGNPTCMFVLAKSNAHVPGTVTVTLTPHTSRAAFAASRRTARHASPVQSLGPQAFYVSGTLAMLIKHNRIQIATDLRVPAGRKAPPRVLRRDIVVLARTIAADQ